MASWLILMQGKLQPQRECYTIPDTQEHWEVRTAFFILVALRNLAKINIKLEVVL